MDTSHCLIVQAWGYSPHLSKVLACYAPFFVRRASEIGLQTKPGGQHSSAGLTCERHGTQLACPRADGQVTYEELFGCWGAQSSATQSCTSIRIMVMCQPQVPSPWSMGWNDHILLFF